MLKLFWMVMNQICRQVWGPPCHYYSRVHRGKPSGHFNFDILTLETVLIANIFRRCSAMSTWPLQVSTVEFRRCLLCVAGGVYPINSHLIFTDASEASGEEPVEIIQISPINMMWAAHNIMLTLITGPSDCLLHHFCVIFHLHESKMTEVWSAG